MNDAAQKPLKPSSLIAVMSEPSVEETERAILALVWAARATLSDIERTISGRSFHDETLLNQKLKSVADGLNGVAGLLRELGDTVEASACELASAAATAAFWHGAVYVGAANRTRQSSTAGIAVAERLEHRNLVIWGKSTEAAREECHRALAALCDAFPNAFDHLDPET